MLSPDSAQRFDLRAIHGRNGVRGKQERGRERESLLPNQFVSVFLRRPVCQPILVEIKLAITSQWGIGKSESGTLEMVQTTFSGLKPAAFTGNSDDKR